GDPVGSRQSRMQRHATAIGMADQVDVLLPPVDEREAPRGLVREPKGVVAAPRSSAGAALVLRGEQMLLSTQRIAEVAPLAGAGTRAMQRDHSFAARWPHCVIVWTPITVPSRHCVAGRPNGDSTRRALRTARFRSGRRPCL